MGWIALARFVQFACVLGLSGTAIWQLMPSERTAAASPTTPAAGAPPVACAATALLGAAAATGWLLLEASTIAGHWSALGALLTSARFAQAAALRAILLVIAALAALLLPHRGRGQWAMLATLGAAAIASFLWTGHGSAGAGAPGVLHAVADALHLICAAVWLGALLMLSAASLRALADQRQTVPLLDGLVRFSRIGPGLIGLLILTGMINTRLLIGPGHWHALLTDPYGWVLIGKLVLFAAMLLLAAQHRYRSTPRLRDALAGAAAGAPIVGRLRRTLIAETALALVVLAAVAILGTLEPPASS